MVIGSKVKLSDLREKDVGMLNGEKFVVSAYSSDRTTVIFETGETQTIVRSKYNPEVTYLGKKRNH